MSDETKAPMEIPRTIIAQAWAHYEQTVLDKNGLAMTPDERAVARRSFYSGVVSMLAVIDFIAEDHVSEQVAELLLSALADEIADYTKRQPIEFVTPAFGTLQ